jgi:hypothetical protein
MAHQNKKHHKSKSEMNMRPSKARRWVFCALIAAILVVGFAIVRAGNNDDVALSAPNGSIARDTQLQGAEEEAGRELNQTYDSRYHETVMLDAAAMQRVLSGSYDDRL